ncbi:MAG: ATPase, partial [Alphaproteobacteria bacterium]|nr:ATPase [Alphaproteobacteria bacterium]
PESSLALRSVLTGLDSFRLVAVHSVASATGSLVIALALLAGRLDAAEAFCAGALDDLWSLEVWGDDAEARQRLNVRQTDIIEAERFLRLLRHQA